MLDTFKNMSPLARGLSVMGAIVATFVLLFAVSCATGGAADDEQASEQTEAAEEVEAAPDEALDIDAEEVRAAYSTDTRELVETLSANSWAAVDGSEVTFSEATFTQSNAKDGSCEEEAYVIEAIDRDRYAAGGTTYDVTVASVVVPEGRALMKLVRTSSQTSEDMVLYSDALASKTGYTRANASMGLVVEGDITRMAGLLNNTQQTMEEVLVDLCSVYYPSATTATWIGEADADWEAQTVTTTFTLDNQARTHVTVIYHMDSGAYETR